MEVKEAIYKRRAYRSLEYVEITPGIINSLAESARLSPSCFNNQPWRYIFVTDPEVLKNMHSALSTGNEWAKAASMIIVVFSKKENDCLIRDREYYLFDTGMATAFIILRATEMGLVAHPIAGYSPKKTREILGIPEEMNVITLVIVGKHSSEMNPLMTESQKEVEKERPERLGIDRIIYLNKYHD
ncbi:MAG: malonic semialdehyde reductase [Candidatus Methanofastidiosum methylothiophilum]|uniref:Malonic semialdehyde reductase n=1 Tax=Candidatus Methanofastidiosum methylothiophilum TaxID=1705564 RepID=A0A150ISG2_9EURY|nr:MAG: malonic semialdehyde reductase [Candidatus Methanofastidiosum methylthiophilus]KYC47614.1 MAG: malonic semialdehyde reductase [Candidatus Methanofastidiosum methylthiophilus]KYC50231.1 MAG: malonic semialdehyde reductase [Candidatus Methanofastidiosum methylthiophilus]